MVKNSATHSQAMCRWLAHPLGIYKAAHPPNSLSRLETWHNGPSLGLIYPEFNWSNVGNTIDDFQVQLDLNTINGGNDWSTKSIYHSRIESSHQSRENRLENCHYWQLSHPSEKSIKPEMLKLGEINISLWNHLPLSELLLVSLIILHSAEEGRVKPRLSESLHLSKLRQLSKALALCPGGNRLSPRRHQKVKKEGGEAGRERTKHNQEKANPNKSPRHTGIELKLTVTRVEGGAIPKPKS